MDFNSIIHTCSAEIVNSYEGEISKLEDHIFKQITSYVQQIVEICKPDVLIYIAVDGVACLAKQIQQRKRRYLTAFRNQMINLYKQRNNINIHDFDSNCITPGTEFMIHLNTYLHQAYKDNKNVIISGHDEEGEGEHKIIKYIKQSPLDSGGDIIYGMDADLIMLALTCEKNNIYLMRDRISKGYDYLNIDQLSKYIISYINLHDYIFICFFLGNDFLPGIQFLKLKMNGLDNICDIYKNITGPIIYKENGKFKINKSNFCNFLEHLTKIEDALFGTVYEEYYNIKYVCNKPMTNLEKFIHEFDNYPIIYKYPSTLIDPIRNTKWRANYYHYLLRSTDVDDIKKITNNYISGLIWTMNYYFNGEYDIGWHYKYDYPPIITDILKYSYIIDFDKMRNDLSISKIQLNAEKQILTVMPPLSINVIPKHLKPILTDINLGCLHYYPDKFSLSTFLKYALHECIPNIPNIHFPTLYDAYSKLSVTS